MERWATLNAREPALSEYLAPEKTPELLVWQSFIIPQLTRVVPRKRTQQEQKQTLLSHSQPEAIEGFLCKLNAFHATLDRLEKGATFKKNEMQVTLGDGCISYCHSMI
jgi:hypothetical protein